MKVIGYICFQIVLPWSKIGFRIEKYANHVNIQVLSSVMIFDKCLSPVKNLNLHSLGDLAFCFGRSWDTWDLLYLGRPQSILPHHIAGLEIKLFYNIRDDAR